MLRDLKRPECRCVRSISAGCLSFAVRDAYFVIAGFRFRVMMRFPIDHHILGYGLRNSANSVLYHHHHPGHYRTKKMFYDYHHITVVKNRIEQEKLFLKVRPGSDFHCSCVLPCCVAFHQPCGVFFLEACQGQEEQEEGGGEAKEEGRRRWQARSCEEREEGHGGQGEA